MTFTPTAEQLACITAATTTKANLIISALAGAAKTSTLVLLAEALAPQRILCLAFNKKIALEMAERLPSNCDSKTLNSLGYRAWADYIRPKRIKLDDSKIFRLTKAAIDARPEADRGQYYDRLGILLDSAKQAKIEGYIPSGVPTGKSLLDSFEFFEGLEENLEPHEQDFVDEVLRESIAEALSGTVDFGDQLYMPTLWPVSFANFPVIMIDEAQDLSVLNHVMLKKIVWRNRLIAVGDPNQAIYAFRGADEQSMHKMQQVFSMTPLVLSTSFRCPIAVVEEARFRTPHMQYPAWAKPGQVAVAISWSAETLPQSAAIICRNNAPLFRTALRLIRDGRGVELLGNDIGAGLLKIMKSLGKPATSRDDALNALTAWVAARKKKNKNTKKIDDQAECIELFLDQGANLDEAMRYAEALFAQAGPIKLMTGHKSKGLEFDDVFFLDRNLLDDEGQDLNLRYVIITRAKSTLTYVSTATYEVKNAAPNDE